MSNHLTPETVVQRQLDAYNAKDLGAWLATYAEDAKQLALGGELLAAGHAAIRARTFPEGPGHVELVCIYQVAQGKIQSATFNIGPPVLVRP